MSNTVVVFYLVGIFLMWDHALAQGECAQAKVDIVIILDSSTSVGENNYKKMKNFCKNFLMNFYLDSGNVRAGIISYATSVHVGFYLNSYNASKQIMDAINDIPNLFGSSNIADALKRMRSELFTAARGDRDGVPNIAIIFTDSLSNINSKRTIPEAIQARADGIHIYAVGIGLTDTHELEAIASEPASENSFNVNDVDDLPALSETIFRAFCPVNKREPLTEVEETISPEHFEPLGTPLPTSNLQNSESADIVIIFHVGHMVRARDLYKGLREFLYDLFAMADVDSGKVKVAFINYGEDAKEVFGFSKYSTKSDLRKAVRNLKLIDFRISKANLGAGLELARTSTFSKAGGSRLSEGVPSALVIITDMTSSSDQTIATKEINQIKNMGVSVFTIGVENADNQELKSLASQPLNEYHQEAGSFAILSDDKSVLTKVTNKIRALQKASSKPPVTTRPPPTTTIATTTTLVTMTTRSKPAFTTATSEPATVVVIQTTERAPHPTTTKEQTTAVPVPTTLSVEETFPTTEYIAVPSQTSISMVIQTTERAPHPTTIKEQTTAGCPAARLDLVFILDSSTFIGQNNYNKMLKFCKDVIQNADIDSGIVRVGIVSYSTTVNVEFYLNFYSTKTEIFNAIDMIQCRNGSRNIAEGLRITRTELYTATNGDRNRVRNVAIILTTGSSDINSERTVPEAEQARADGIHIYAVGIGLQDTSEFDAIASPPKELNSFNMQDFDELTILSKCTSNRNNLP